LWKIEYSILFNSTITISDLSKKKDTSLFDMLEANVINRPNSIQDNYIPLQDKYISEDLPLQMKGILQPIFNFEDNLFAGNYSSVLITNYGNAEVNNIKLHLGVEIRNSKELVAKKMLREIEKTEINFQLDDIVSRNGGQLKIPLLSTASFPFYNLTLSGSYSDVRTKFIL